LPSCATIHMYRRWFLTSSAHHGGFWPCYTLTIIKLLIQVAPTVSLRCSGASPWSCDGSRSASVDVFTSLRLKHMTSPNSVNYFTRTKLVLYKNPTKNRSEFWPNRPTLTHSISAKSGR
jgi:hypothetical protein